MSQQSGSIEYLTTKVEELILKVSSLEKDIKKHIDEKYELIELLEVQIEKKIDVIANLDKSSSSSSGNAASGDSSKKKETPLNFLYRELKTNVDKFLNVLYTSDDIENLSSNDKVTSTNGAIAKRKKLISLIYSEIIKPNKEISNKLNDIMNQSN
jgi:hypothetical protein